MSLSNWDNQCPSAPQFLQAWDLFQFYMRLAQPGFARLCEVVCK